MGVPVVIGEDNLPYRVGIGLTDLPNIGVCKSDILIPLWHSRRPVQVNLCQKLLFLHQLTHNMTTDLSIELQVQYMKIPSSNLGRTCCVQKLFLTFRTIFVHNMFSPCSAKRRASDKDLPVQNISRENSGSYFFGRRSIIISYVWYSTKSINRMVKYQQIPTVSGTYSIPIDYSGFRVHERKILPSKT